MPPLTHNRHRDGVEATARCFQVVGSFLSSPAQSLAFVASQAVRHARCCVFVPVSSTLATLFPCLAPISFLALPLSRIVSPLLRLKYSLSGVARQFFRSAPLHAPSIGHILRQHIFHSDFRECCSSPPCLLAQCSRRLYLACCACTGLLNPRLCTPFTHSNLL